MAGRRYTSRRTGRTNMNRRSKYKSSKYTRKSSKKSSWAYKYNRAYPLMNMITGASDLFLDA